MLESASQVLVVDNAYETRKLVAALLQRIGVQSILVKDGTTALTLLNEGLTPALVIVEMALSEMSGIDVVKQIRLNQKLATVPVMLLVDTIDPQAIRQGLNAGADAYVARQYLTNSLIDRARVLIAAGRMPLAVTRVVGRTAPLQSAHTDTAFLWTTDSTKQD